MGTGENHSQKTGFEHLGLPVGPKMAREFGMPLSIARPATLRALGHGVIRGVSAKAKR